MDADIERASRWIELEAAAKELTAALGDPKLEQRCIRYLASIDDLLERVRVGNLLFGKRYHNEVHPRTFEVT